METARASQCAITSRGACLAPLTWHLTPARPTSADARLVPRSRRQLSDIFCFKVIIFHFHIIKLSYKNILKEYVETTQTYCFSPYF